MKNLKVMHAQVCIDKIFNNAKLPDFPDTADAQQKVFFHSFNQPNKTLHDTPQSALCEKKSKDRFLARRPVQQQRQLERGNNCRFQRSTRRQTVDHIEQ